MRRASTKIYLKKFSRAHQIAWGWLIEIAWLAIDLYIELTEETVKKKNRKRFIGLISHMIFAFRLDPRLSMMPTWSDGLTIVVLWSSSCIRSCLCPLSNAFRAFGSSWPILCWWWVPEVRYTVAQSQHSSWACDFCMILCETAGTERVVGSSWLLLLTPGTWLVRSALVQGLNPLGKLCFGDLLDILW